MSETRWWDVFGSDIHALNELTQRGPYGSPADAILRLVNGELARLAEPECQPVTGPLAAFAIALERGRDILRGFVAEREQIDAIVTMATEPASGLANVRCEKCGTLDHAPDSALDFYRAGVVTHGPDCDGRYVVIADEPAARAATTEGGTRTSHE